MTPAIRLLLADDHAIVRMGLKSVFELEPGFDVAGEAATADEAVAAHRALRPDITLLDLRMPGGGMDALRRILTATPAARLLILTTSDAEEDIHQALAAGARGYVLKTTPPELLADAIRAVHLGEFWIPPEIARRLADRASAPDLSPREREVLHLVIKGLTNPEIAAALTISLGTAKAHVRAIIAKLQVSDRTEAAGEAYRRGLIQ